MSDTYTYNQEACSKKDVDVPYAELWTLGQQEAIRRLCTKVKIESKTTASYELVKNFSARADRIAANYARIYLEIEKAGNPKLKGRFYWTGLAAFASKQVRCALDYADTKWRYVHAFPLIAFEKTLRSLGKGNFWLFQDIFVWHWFYVNYPSEFYKAAPHRNWKKYINCFQESFQSLPWIDDALPKINFLQETDYLINGFKLISRLEKISPTDDSFSDTQLESLMAIANHEQIKILQPLIYDDFLFRRLLNGQAAFEGRGGIPRRLASMSTACEKDENYDTVMKTGNLYDPMDRMNFIKDIADNYHRLMTRQADEMEHSLVTIASWSSHA